MKTLTITAFTLLLAFALESCTPKMNFMTSSVVPAANGEITIKKDKNGNFVVHVNVLNLAPPERLSPPQQAYIVWMESAQNSSKKLGLLKPESNLLSKALKASLSAPAIAEPIRVFITAEQNPAVEQPEGVEILTTTRR